MTLSVTHQFVSAIADDPAAVTAGEVVPTNWNDTHTVSGTIDVANGGTGAATLTGILQGNGTSAITAITDASTAGQIVRATAAATYAMSTTTWPNSLDTNGVLHQAFGANNAGTRSSFTFDGSTMQVGADAVASDMSASVIHTGTGSTGRAVLKATVQSGGGDSVAQWIVDSTQTWTSGIDVSASNAWKLSASAALGTTDIIAITTAGVVTLGVAGTTAGVIALSGSGSGVVTVQTAAAAGTWSLTLPTTDGNSGEFLQTDGAGVTTWAAASAGSTPKDLFVFRDLNFGGF